MENEHNEKCAPSKEYSDGSCFSLKSLKNISKKANNLGANINITDNKKELVSQLTKYFSSKNSCKSQTCWLRTELVKSMNDEDIEENTFRPVGPKKKYEWLSTTHINDVVSQYEEKYNDFIFLGALPNDFEELPFLGLSNINFDDYLNKGKNKLGMVINLDTHNQSGSHWVALFIDLLNYKLYYFDSVGKKPGKRIKKFNNKIVNFMYKKKYGDELNVNKILALINNIDDETRKNKYYTLLKNKLKSFDIRFNPIQHQKANTECGVYSINFILRLAKNESFNTIISNITDDEEMNKCRKVYFRNT